MTEEDAAAPRNRIVNVRAIPPHPFRPGQFPPSSRPGGLNFTRTKEPLLKLWRRMLGRYWLPAILLWLAISCIVLTLTYYPLIVSFIDFRLAVAAAMITGAAAAIWGAFQWIEIRSGRVTDPDLLAERMQSPVYTLPPLPTRRIREWNPLEADAIIDQFYNRFDHLWFAICGNREEPRSGQCVLVTSAVREEGRTTLAAHLAVRCGRARTSTLLIDADLRGSALLNKVLEIPAGPGLSEVLAGKADFHDALISISEGLFHLLQAGTPVQDTLRYLHDPKFGMVIARCRERFDLTIIDCGPVVPSPEPLALCKWVDGILLAARYDFSRYRDIEWARHKLAATGIPILAVVVNAYPSTIDERDLTEAGPRRSSPHAYPWQPKRKIVPDGKLD
jgi:Mrp family chromosome partitioning ATPase